MARWSKDLTYVKDPADQLDYQLDFTGLLQGDSISTATVTGTNVTIDSSSVLGNTVTVFVSGGSDGSDGVVKTTIVTTNATPRTFKRSFNIQVRSL